MYDVRIRACACDETHVLTRAHAGGVFMFIVVFVFLCFLNFCGALCPVLLLLSAALRLQPRPRLFRFSIRIGIGRHASGVHVHVCVLSWPVHQSVVYVLSSSPHLPPPRSLTYRYVCTILLCIIYAYALLAV